MSVFRVATASLPPNALLPYTATGNFHKGQDKVFFIWDAPELRTSKEYRRHVANDICKHAAGYDAVQLALHKYDAEWIDAQLDVKFQLEVAGFAVTFFYYPCSRTEKTVEEIMSLVAEREAVFEDRPRSYRIFCVDWINWGSALIGLNFLKGGDDVSSD